MLGKRTDDFVFVDNFPNSTLSLTPTSSESLSDSSNENAPDIHQNNNSGFNLQAKNPNLLQQKKKRIIIYKDANLNESSEDESDDNDGRTKRHRRRGFKHQTNESYEATPGPKMFWTKDEDDLLISKVKEFGHRWSYISQFFPTRKPTNIMTHYKSIIVQNLSNEDRIKLEEDGDAIRKPIKQPWTEDEEKLLAEKVQELGCNWVKIKTFFPNRTASSISLHWSQKKKKQETISQPKERDSKPITWSKEEDELLLKLLKEHGVKWNELLPFFPNRSINGISQHWSSKLRPNVSVEELNEIMKHTNPCFNIEWNDANDQLLATKFKEIGPKWDELINFFPGVDARFLKDRWVKCSRFL